MSSPPAPPLDGWTLDAFLCSMRGSESAAHSGHCWTAGLSGSESSSPIASRTPSGPPNHCQSEAYRQSPAAPYP